MPSAATSVEVVASASSTIGESPAWWAEKQRLITVDMAVGLVRMLDVTTGDETTTSFDGEVGAAVPRVGGGLVVAVDHELRAFDATGAPDKTWEVEGDLPNNRLNDCRADAQGRLWAGTISKTRATDTAGLYRIGASGEPDRMLPATLANGMTWSPDGRVLYFVESSAKTITRYDVDLETGDLSRGLLFAEIDAADGMPDGLTVDTEGGVWVALFGGGAIRRYGADGRQTHHIALPVTNPTCPAFGGPDLDTLYVTSATVRLSEEQLAAEPAGALLALSVEFGGYAANRFDG